MGLNKDSMGLKAMDLNSGIRKIHDGDKVIALGGNPNVGKSTVFNELTGLRQHTGNWPGKTVTMAQGYCTYKKNRYLLVDLPGCYSLMAHSAEEEVACDFLCFGDADAVIIVCDATCLERSLNLVLQTLEITSKVIVCMNLMDEAKKRNIEVDLQELSKRLGVPVVGTAARSKTGLDALMKALEATIGFTESSEVSELPTPLSLQDDTSGACGQSPIRIEYPVYIEEAISFVEPYTDHICHGIADSRWFSLMLLYWGQNMPDFIEEKLKTHLTFDKNILQILKEVKEKLKSEGITEREMKDDMVSAIVHTAERICKGVISSDSLSYRNRDFDIDRLLTGKWTAFPVMILALMGVFWITITGANYPSQIISDFLFWIEEYLLMFFQWLNAPQFLYEMLVLGVYRVLAWVVSVMLPPMALFFPLFTLLEDVGFLPRIAFNLDKCFHKCCACGKQALTMCMEFLYL